jgi:hypothetical protein
MGMVGGGNNKTMNWNFPELEQQAMQRYIDAVLAAFVAPRGIEYQQNRAWRNQFPAHPGVYGIYRIPNQLIYVGESGNLRGRMGDLFDTRHHVLRRSLGQQLFSNQPGFEMATARRQFPMQMELDLNELMQNEIQVHIFVSLFGRKELEERLIQEYRPVFNQRGQREG